MKRRSDRILVWALATSLAAHAVLLYLAQGMRLGDASPQQKPPPPTSIVHLATPKPPPPPPVVTPRPVAVRQVRPRAVAVRPHLPTLAHAIAVGPVPPIAPGPPGPVVPGDDGPPGPVAPTAAPGPACSEPQADAKAIDPIVPDEPALAQEEGLTGTAEIQVTLDAGGDVTGAIVYRSSGSPLLDAAAIQAAKRSRYRAEIRDCASVSGSYLFTATFQ